MLQTPNSPNLVPQIAKRTVIKNPIKFQKNLMPHGTESLLIAS